MDWKEYKILILRYIDAYNSFDVDPMLSSFHPEIIFKNLSAGEITAEAVGIDQFRQMAEQSKTLFSNRRQEAIGFSFDKDTA